MPERNSTRAALYFRMSSEKQEDSIDRQRSQVTPYARARSYTVIGEYVDEGVPGDEFERLVGFQKMLNAARRGEFSVIVIDEQSRLSRLDDWDFIADVARPLRNAGITVDTVNKGIIDWESLCGRLMSSIQANQSHEESRNLSRRVLTGLLNRVLERSAG
jgi:DNA invertase Pin-like site-specific DNA recombinase